MRVLKVCIYDEEVNYARKLSAFLNRQGEGRFKVTAVTNMDSLMEYMGNGQFDILLASNPDTLCRIKKMKENIYVLWLMEKEENNYNREIAGMAAVSRYAGAKKISQMVEEAAAGMVQRIGQVIPITAIYSPVGRCGKTSLALEIVQKAECRWIYIGMEDYGCMGQQNKKGNPEETGDTFLYYVRERKKEQLFDIIEGCEGVISSAFSPFDSKMLCKEDWEWMVHIMQEYNSCGGVVFDVGTGILQEPVWLSVFDYIVVPYLKDEPALQKKERFEALIEAYGLYELQEKLRFVDMGNEEEIRESKQELWCRR